MRNKWLVVLAVVTSIAAAACTPSGPPPPPPANAQTLTEAGAYDQRLDDVTQELRDALETRYGPLEVKAYKLPLPSGWPTVNAYYQAALSEWKAEPALPKNVRAARARAWTRDGAVFAMALIDKPIAGQNVDFKLLIVAANPPEGPQP